MATTQKAKDIARDLEILLGFRLSGLAVSRGFDTDDNPWFLFGTDVAGTANVRVKVAPLTFGPSNPITGHAANYFVPHVVQVVTEAASTTGTLTQGVLTQGVLTQGVLTQGVLTQGVLTQAVLHEAIWAPLEENFVQATMDNATVTDATVTPATMTAATMTAATVTAATVAAIADPLTPAQVLSVLGEAVRTGCCVEWYNSASGDSPDLNDITSSKLVATFQPAGNSMMSTQ